MELRPTKELRFVMKRITKRGLGKEKVLQQKFEEIGYDENGNGDMESYVQGEVWVDVPTVEEE